MARYIFYMGKFKYGEIFPDDEGEPEVLAEDERAEAALKEFLNSKTQFLVPKSSKIDDFEFEEYQNSQLFKEDVGFFEQALNRWTYLNKLSWVRRET